MRGIATTSHPWLVCALILVALIVGACSGSGGAGFSPAQNGARPPRQSGSANAASEFSVTSETFTNNTTVPQSMVFHGVAGSTCSGGNKSPQLTWVNAPAGTRSFVVVMFDVTASFTHWGMYNIPASTTSLPNNAGVAGSEFGTQVLNDFLDAKYDGPCPPPGLVHHYIITVYALDRVLTLPAQPGFPQTAETLFNALVTVREHILGSTSITGLYSTG